MADIRTQLDAESELEEGIRFVPPTDKALAVMTPPKMTRIHYDAITLAVLEEQANDESPPRWLSDIESLVRYLVAHPERLAGEDEVVVPIEGFFGLKSLRFGLLDCAKQLENFSTGPAGRHVASLLRSAVEKDIDRWLAGSPTAQESKDG